MEKYYIKIKDEIAISIDSKIPKVGSFDCDSYEETDFNFAMNANLPCKKVSGEWVHTDEYPVIEYPVSEPMPETEVIDTETDLMEMAIDHEYRLTLLELGITE